LGTRLKGARIIVITALLHELSATAKQYAASGKTPSRFYYSSQCQFVRAGMGHFESIFIISGKIAGIAVEDSLFLLHPDILFNTSFPLE